MENIPENKTTPDYEKFHFKELLEIDITDPRFLLGVCTVMAIFTQTPSPGFGTTC